MFENDSYHSVDDSFTKLLKNIKPCWQTTLVSVFESKGHVLKEDIISDIDLPLFPSSHMDGFALNSNETVYASESNPISFRISNAKSLLGIPPSVILKSGEAYRIQTGGYLPNSSDAVIPVENAHIANQGSIEVIAPIKKGSYVYAAGADVKKGEKVLDK